jgi:hypothetical protein
LEWLNIVARQSLEILLSACGADLRAILPSLSNILRTSDQIALFGSRAANSHTNVSDWDLFYVGPRRPRLRRNYSWNVDLVWVPSDRLASPEWLGSELAGHIAKYGRWIMGTDSWTHKVVRSNEAIVRKTEFLRLRLSSLNQYWAVMTPGYQRRLCVLIRRDLQRLEYLRDGFTIPPSPNLDAEWRQKPETYQRLLRMAEKNFTALGVLTRIDPGFFELPLSAPVLPRS